MSSINSSEDKDGKVETSGNDSSMSGKKPLGGESPKIGQSLETMMSFIVVLAGKFEVSLYMFYAMSFFWVHYWYYKYYCI